MADVFISYAKTDRIHAERLASALAEEGWSVWWDPHIEPGEDFDEVIESELKLARSAVVIWSERSCKSRYVKGEARDAMAQGKLAPAFIEEVKPPYDFRSIQGAQLQEWDGDTRDAEYQKLVHRLARRLEDADPDHSVETKKPRQTARPRSNFHAQGDIYRDRLKDESEGPEMVVIPAGEFLMGSPASESKIYKNEGPQHRVRIEKPFAIGKYPITFAEYDIFTDANNLEKLYDRDWGRGRRPVINVNSEDASAYVKWLSEQTGKYYRLPTEAEWEYAARAGTTTPFHYGEQMTTEQANFNGRYMYTSSTIGEYRKSTVEVGRFPANAFGLHDVHGNVWEWVEDCWHDNYEGAPVNGSAWLIEGGGDCGRRVIRGGSWYDSQLRLRSTFRKSGLTDYRIGNIGFRLAQDL